MFLFFGRFCDSHRVHAVLEKSWNFGGPGKCPGNLRGPGKALEFHAVLKFQDTCQKLS